MMRSSWLFCAAVALLFAACDGDSSSSSDDAVDAPDSGEADDETDPDDSDDDTDDDPDGDDADDDGAGDDPDDDGDDTDDDPDPDDGPDPDDSDDGNASDDSGDDVSDAGDDTNDPSEAGSQDPEAGADDTSDSGAAPSETVTVGEQEGGVGIEVTFSGEGVECGMDRCRDATVDSFGIGASGCCFDEAESACGLNMSTLGLALGLSMPGCEQLDAPGSYDEACSPSDPIPVLLPEAPDEGVVMPGCCLPSGECGFSAQFGDWGFGCVAAERFNQESPGSCEYTP